MVVIQKLLFFPLFIYRAASKVGRDTIFIYLFILIKRYYIYDSYLKEIFFFFLSIDTQGGIRYMVVI